MKVLVDTNVLLDFLCKRIPFCADAESVFMAGLKHKIELYICGISFVNAIYTARKYGVDKSACINSLKGLLTFCEVSDISKDIIQNSLNSNWKDLEDAVQYYSGLSSGIDCVVTRDSKGFLLSGVCVYTPRELLDAIE